MSYRLGVFGWSAFKEDEHSKVGNGNNAMYDVLAAAEWLKREAAALGADPERIVIFGESSGATDAQLMTLVPAARGLVSGAIAESGGLYASDVEDAISTTKQVATKVEQAATKQQLAAFGDRMAALEAALKR